MRLLLVNVEFSKFRCDLLDSPELLAKLLRRDVFPLCTTSCRISAPCFPFAIVGHHDYVHENPMSLAEETKVMQMGLEALSRIGVKPRVYRSPYWDFSPNTLSILEEYGFSADSSLMGNDFHPYVIRRVEVQSAHDFPARRLD